MKKKMAGTSLVVMVIIFLIGIVLVFSSQSIGQNMGDKAVQNNGGSLETSRYDRIVDSYTSNFRSVGLVVMLVSGFGILLSGAGLYKEL